MPSALYDDVATTLIATEDHRDIDQPSELDETLATYGWSTSRQVAFGDHAAAGLIPGRVISSEGTMIAATAHGKRRIILQRRFRQTTTDRVDLPAVGDWLALEIDASDLGQALVRAVLPRSGTFMRNRLSDGRAQVIAANVDIAFIVSGLDHDLNLRRIERYLVLARDGGIEPVVVLNKADVALDLDAALAAVDDLLDAERLLTISAATGSGMEEIRGLLLPGMTACLLGSSGVGKSTITNALLGEQRQTVRNLRADDSRGRHTTTHRDLFVLAGGALLIDTPGLRTVGVRGDADAVAASFADIEAVAASCRFFDCLHQTEPGCAVLAAIEDGSLAQDRLDSYRKLEAERRAFEARSTERSRRTADRARTRVYARTTRHSTRVKRGDGGSSS